MNGLFVTGTDTNIGKTWIGSHLISALCRKGIDVIPRKPVESGWTEDITLTDAWLLASSAKKLNCLDDICPNRFSHPLSPVRAATIEGIKLSINTLKEQCLNQANRESFLFVEGAGGFYSPLCFDGLNADLASVLKLPILLIAENRLGCINQVLLNVEAIKNRGLLLKAIVINSLPVDKRAINNRPENMNNMEDLLDLVDCPVISIMDNEESHEPFNKLASLILSGGNT